MSTCKLSAFETCLICKWNWQLNSLPMLHHLIFNSEYETNKMNVSEICAVSLKTYNRSDPPSQEYCQTYTKEYSESWNTRGPGPHCSVYVCVHTRTNIQVIDI